MSALGDFMDVKNNILRAKKTTIVAVHKFVFEEEGDRDNRKRIRQFQGFIFDINDDEYKRKRKYVKENLNDGDLVAVCNVLGLSYNNDDLFQHIFINMKKGQLLCCQDNDEDVENSEDECNDDNDEHNDDYDDVNDDNDQTIVFNDARNNTITNNDAAQAKKNVNDGRVMENASKSKTTCYSEYTNTCEQKDVKQQLVKEEKTTCLNMQRFSVNYRDIEDSIPFFDGDGNMPIEAWIEEFDETSAIMGFDDFQKFIFAKKSLKGLAKLYVTSERGITTYSKLTSALKNEFGSTINGAKLHKMMIERKMNKSESVHEYFFSMKELASRGNIDESTLMEYVIDGINDLTVNKSILYGATNLKDFKVKLKCYETMVERRATSNKNKNDVKEKVCFNCGRKGHESKNCRDKDKGAKCFNCNKFGHVSKDCPAKQEKANIRQLVTTKLNPMEFDVQFLSKEAFSAKTLFDQEINSM